MSDVAIATWFSLPIMPLSLHPDHFDARYRLLAPVHLSSSTDCLARALFQSPFVAAIRIMAADSFVEGSANAIMHFVRNAFQDDRRIPRDPSFTVERNRHSDHAGI